MQGSDTPAATATALPLRYALRYVQPLREGGSLPAIVDTDDGLFVVKFRGAGQGPRALLAELIAGLLARSLGLPVPELALVHVAPLFGRSEPDPEIQDVLRASTGINVGIRYLDGAFNFDALAAGDLIDETFASAVVWFDAFMTNPDRTHRNPNLLICRRRPWLIDHGAALYAHHDWSSVDENRTRAPFPLIRDHVLLARAADIAGADKRSVSVLSDVVIDGMLQALPESLLDDPLAREPFTDTDALRQRYRSWLIERLRAPRTFVTEAVAARERRLAETPRRLGARR